MDIPSTMDVISGYAGSDDDYKRPTLEEKKKKQQKRLEQVQVVPKDQYDRNDLRQEMKGTGLELGMNPTIYDQKRYNLSPDSMWDLRTFISPEEYGAKFQRSLDPRTGLPLKGAGTVQNIKNTVIDAASVVNQTLDTAVEALPEELDSTFELLQQLSTQSAETIFSVLGSGWASLPEGVRKNVTSGGATVLQTMDNGIVGLAQATGFDPAIVDVGLGVAETVFTAGTSKAGRKFFKEGAKFFSRKGPPTAGGLVPVGVPNSIFSKGINLYDDVNLSKNFFEARTSGGIGFGSTKNIPFKGTTRGAIDLSGMSTSARKTAKQNFFTNIYTAGKSEQGLKAVKYSRRYIFGGKANITGTHRDIFQMAPHHFTIDDDLAFMAANTADAPKFVQELHKFGIYPGNHPRNFIASYHDNTKKGWNETLTQIKNLWGNKPNAPSDSAIIKFLKNPPKGIEFGSNTKLEDIGKQLVTIQQKGLDGRDWSQILPKGIKRTDIKISPVVLGIDHQQLIHGVVDNLPSRQKLIKLIESDQWLRLSPRQRAIEVAKVSRESQNVALRINQIRLNLIKKRMSELGKSTEHWTDIQAWMAANPSEAASLSWHKLTKGSGLTVNDLIQDLPKDEVKEIATIFNLEAIPNTGELLDKLNKTSSKTFKEL